MTSSRVISSLPIRGMDQEVAEDSFAPAHCASCPARGHGFCSRLPDPLKSRFQRAVRTFAPDRAGAEIDRALGAWDLAVVSRGTLAIRSAFEDGQRAITDFMVPGELLHSDGEGARESRQVTASPDFRLCLIPNLEAAFASDDCRCLERYVRSDAVHHIEELRRMIAALARLAPRERIAYLLLGLRKRLDPDGRTIDLPFSRGDIADLLGMRTETVSRALRELEQAGLIHRDGTRAIEILDPAGLEQAAGA